MSLPFPLIRRLWQPRHPSRLPYGALRAALTGPVGAANTLVPSRGNGRLCLARFPIRAVISLPLVGSERSGKPDISLATKTGHFHVLITGGAAPKGASIRFQVSNMPMAMVIVEGQAQINVTPMMIWF
jgi:hypothetical protein